MKKAEFKERLKAKTPEELIELLWVHVKIVRAVETDAKRGLMSDEIEAKKIMKKALGLSLMAWEK